MAENKYQLLQAPISESTDTPEDLGPDEARRLRGFVAQGRSLVSADGRVKAYDTQILGSAPILGFERFRTHGRGVNDTLWAGAKAGDAVEARTLAKCGGAIWLDVSSDGSGDFRPVAARTSGKAECFTAYGDWMYCANGTDPVIRLDGNFYCLGTASCAGGTTRVVGTGTQWEDASYLDHDDFGLTDYAVSPGDKVFFKISGAWSLTPYTIAKLYEDLETGSGAADHSDNWLELTTNGPNTGGAVEYIIVKSHLSGIVMPTALTGDTYTVSGDGALPRGVYNYRYILQNPVTGTMSNASSERADVIVDSEAQQIDVVLPSELSAADAQATELLVYRTKGHNAFSSRKLGGQMDPTKMLLGGAGVQFYSPSEAAGKRVEIVGTVYDSELGAGNSRVVRSEVIIITADDYNVSVHTDWDRIIGLDTYAGADGVPQVWSMAHSLRKMDDSVIGEFPQGSPARGPAVYRNLGLAYSGVVRFVFSGTATFAGWLVVKGLDIDGNVVYASAHMNPDPYTGVFSTDIEFSRIDMLYLDMMPPPSAYEAGATGWTGILPPTTLSKVYYYHSTLSRLSPATADFTFPDFNDQMADNELGDLMPSIDGREPPPKFSEMKLYNDRLHGWGDTDAPYRGRRAGLAAPEYWPLVQIGADGNWDGFSAGFVDFGTRGSRIVAVAPEAGAYTTNGMSGSCLLVAASTGDCWRWFDSGKAYAYALDLVAGSTLQNCGGVMVGLTRHGLNAVPAGGAIVSRIDRSMSELIPDSVADPVMANLAKATSIYCQGQYVMAWAQGGSDNSQVLIYRPGQGGGYTGLLPESVSVNFHQFKVWEDGDLYAADEAGWIWKLFSYPGDDTFWNIDGNEGVSVELWTKNFTLSGDKGVSNLYSEKHLRRVVFAFECDTDDQDIKLEVFANGNDNTPVFTQTQTIKGNTTKARVYVIFRPEKEARQFSLRLTGVFTRRVRFVWGQLLYQLTSEQEGT